MSTIDARLMQHLFETNVGELLLGLRRILATKSLGELGNRSFIQVLCGSNHFLIVDRLVDSDDRHAPAIVSLP